MIDYKTATRDALLAEFQRLSKVVCDQSFGTKKEFLHLPKILADGETPIAVASGMMNGNTWLIVLTNSRVIFLDKGLLYGLRQVDVRLNDIASVSCETGLLLGSITISTTATNYTISNVIKRAVNPFTNMVNDARNPAISTPPDTNKSTNKLDQLERLAALKEKGVLSDDEFLSEKAKILAM